MGFSADRLEFRFDTSLPSTWDQAVALCSRQKGCALATCLTSALTNPILVPLWCEYACNLTKEQQNARIVQRSPTLTSDAPAACDAEPAVPGLKARSPARLTGDSVPLRQQAGILYS